MVRFKGFVLAGVLGVGLLLWGGVGESSGKLVGVLEGPGGPADINGGTDNGASAVILGVAPGSVIDDPPGAVNGGQQGFDERQGVLLTSPLAVDGGFIAPGRRVNSHMIFLNTPQDSSGGDVTAEHWGVRWRFNNRVLGVMSKRDGSLEVASSGLLGLAGTVYPGSPFNARGLEDTGDGTTNMDGYSVSGRTVTVAMRVSEPGDWIRVVTAVPVPAAGWMGLPLLGVLGAVARRRMG